MSRLTSKADTLPELIAVQAPEQLPKFRAALSRARLGLANASIFCVGDSTTFGLWGANGTTTGARPFSWPVRMANTYLNGHPLFGTVDAQHNWNPNSVDGVVTTNYDQRVTFGGGWLRLSSGGRMLVTGHCFSNQGADGDMVLTTAKTIDTIDFWTMDRSAGKSFEVLVNGVSVGTVNTATGSATAALVKHSLSFAAKPAGTITVRAAAGTNNVSIAWVDACNSAQRQVTVVNCGWSGALASTFNADAGVPFGRLMSVGTYSPDLMVLDLTINDILNSDAATFQQNLEALIANARGYGIDVLLLTGTPIRADVLAYAGKDVQFNGIVKGLAKKYALPFLDVYARFGSYATAHAAMPYYDSTHPQALGYDAIARGVAGALLDLV